jgi:hypothetical protein
MSLTIVSATNPQYTNAESTAIDLLVQFAEFSEIIPFHAVPHDNEAHGVELYNNAKAGQYGEIAAYVPPPPVEQPATTGTKTA